MRLLWRCGRNRQCAVACATTTRDSEHDHDCYQTDGCDGEHWIQPSPTLCPPLCTLLRFKGVLGFTKRIFQFVERLSLSRAFFLSPLGLTTRPQRRDGWWLRCWRRWQPAFWFWHRFWHRFRWFKWFWRFWCRFRWLFRLGEEIKRVGVRSPRRLRDGLREGLRDGLHVRLSVAACFNISSWSYGRHGQSLLCRLGLCCVSKQYTFAHVERLGWHMSAPPQHSKYRRCGEPTRGFPHPPYVGRTQSGRNEPPQHTTPSCWSIEQYMCQVDYAVWRVVHQAAKIHSRDHSVLAADIQCSESFRFGWTRGMNGGDICTRSRIPRSDSMTTA